MPLDTVSGDTLGFDGGFDYILTGSEKKRALCQASCQMNAGRKQKKKKAAYAAFVVQSFKSI